MWKFFTNAGTEKVEVQPETPAGLITSFAGASAPTGWLLCQGQELSRTTYAKLDAALGQVYGAYTNGSNAAGNTHFRLPDVRGRVVVSRNAGLGDGGTGTGAVSGTAITERGLGEWGGSENVTLSGAETALPSHSHATTSSHTHTITDNHQHVLAYDLVANVSANGTTIYRAVNGTGRSTNAASGGYSITAATSGITSSNSVAATAASASHSNTQPFLVLNFIIKT